MQLTSGSISLENHFKVYIRHVHRLVLCMSHPSKPKTLSYPEAVRLSNDEPFLIDFKEALQSLSQSLISLLHSFESVSKQLHSLDLQGLIAPLKPNWNALYKVPKPSLYLYYTSCQPRGLL